MVLEAEVQLQGNHGHFCIQSETRADLSLNVLVFIIPVMLYIHISPAFLRPDCSTLTVSTLSIFSDPAHLILLTTFHVLKTNHQQMAKCSLHEFLLMPMVFTYFFSLKLY